MAQLSRPYQIGLAAIAVLAAAWFVLLQGHSSSPSSTAGVSAAVAPSAAHTAKSPAATAKASHKGAAGKTGGSIYHGSAPGVEGLTRDIAKAKGAVSTSQTNAKQLEEKSAQASSTTSAATPAAAAATPTTAPSTASSTAATSAAPATSPAKGAGKITTKTASIARQSAVEAQLAQGKTALILFWNPAGADDTAVHDALKQLRSDHHLRIAINEARASEVAAFGSITRGVQIYGTPTLLIVSKGGKTEVLTGLQVRYTIEQAIQEAHQS